MLSIPVTVELNHEQKELEKTTTTHYSPEKYYRKKYEENNITITLNVLYTKAEKIYPVYI